MRILLVSDAWLPQVNGVVTSLQALVAQLRDMGHWVKVISPADFRCLPCPGYGEIGLAWNLWRLGPMIREFRPDCVHIATEGPLGWAARGWLRRRGLLFTTALHTRFADYVKARWPWLPLRLGIAYLRCFHRPSQAILVSTPRLQEECLSWGLGQASLWHKGVDSQLFHPGSPAAAESPLFLYVGRLAAEKNLSAFLELDLPGRKCVVGDGPQRTALQQAYPQVEFCGYLQGQALADAYRQASVLVFPSRTDTYGLVMLEAMACGTPVAAFAVPGPLDIVQQGVTGYLADDLAEACLAAVQLDRQDCARWAASLGWRSSAEVFLAAQQRLEGDPLGQWQVV